MAWQLIHYGTKFALLFYTLFHFIYTFFIHIFFLICLLYVNYTSGVPKCAIPSTPSCA